MFRLGGTSADASVVRLSGGLFRILSSVGEPNLGGEQFTTALAEYLTKEFQKYDFIANLWCIIAIL